MITMKKRYSPDCFQDAIDLVSRGLIDLRLLITHAYKFEDSIEAFNAVKDGHGRGKLTGKVVILNEKFVGEKDFVTMRR